MKIKLLLIVFFAANFLNAQSTDLENKKLIKYFSQINKAELKITENKLDSANILYKSAFKTFKQKFAKDTYNSFQVALQLKDWKNAFKQYKDLKCMEFQFEDVKFPAEFEEYIADKKISCKTKINYQYRKTLDSLFVIDQRSRKLSGGNYKKYQKEITRDDSIASINLLKLIQQNGFPNEYDLGLKKSNKVFFQEFYHIIWHQLKSNLYSPQRVNFTQEIIKALNKGKILPEHAGFLMDLNNNTSNYNSSIFEIHQLIELTRNKDNTFTAMDKGEYITDCCYLHPWYYPEKRNERGVEMVKKLDGHRKKIGLSSIDDELKKRTFALNNKDYILVQNKISGHQFEDPEEGRKFYKGFIKIEVKK